MQPARPTVQIDDDRFRVTEWHFEPGTETGWHRHEFDYVVVPMTTGRLTIETADGPLVAELIAGRSYTRHAGVEHNVTNRRTSAVTFVEIERRT
jgi:beta-alanine degradation protein BauB